MYDFCIITDIRWKLMGFQSQKVDALSELFVSWDDIVTDAEDKLAKLERQREAKRRMGLE
jgi:hypothetical protein